jgi:hypothetical protein
VSADRFIHVQEFESLTSSQSKLTRRPNRFINVGKMWKCIGQEKSEAQGNKRQKQTDNGDDET